MSTQFTPAQIDCILDIYKIVVSTGASADRFQQLLEDVRINDPDADAAIKSEREACAFVAFWHTSTLASSDHNACARAIATAIRARTTLAQ